MSSSSESSSSSSASVGRRGVRLLRAAVVGYVANAVDGFRFTVTAHDPVDMPAEIFLYLRRPQAPATGGVADEFTSVCSPADLEEYPIGEPTGTPPFFRDSSVDLVFRSRAEADDAWTQIRADVTALVRTLDLMDNLEDAEDVQIGG